LHKYHTLSAYINRGNPPSFPQWTTWIPYFSTHFNRGNPPSIPQYRTWRSCPPQRSRSYQWRVLLNSYIERMKQAFNRKIRPREFQEDLMLKRTLSFQPESKGIEMPNHKGW